MFDDHTGLPAEVATQWAALVEDCRPVLAHQGMQAVQELLVEREMSAFQAIAITRALLGGTKIPLREAIEAVLTSAARAAADSAG
ncbi:MAG TPA: hypothetical protein VGZ32_19225 [Actinocrinis sp.]|jgi:hypothetical protein|uniref:hypothetical protein n=1 Tax=Actinocrinis sp. TaxID=1920516 RepID=UPI002DDD5A72|nr:hypothetical protein [Actinocrinis sp.]HEV3172486.1 hypothetical protein [Actinocrinis sp.]